MLIQRRCLMVAMIHADRANDLGQTEFSARRLDRNCPQPLLSRANW